VSGNFVALDPAVADLIGAGNARRDEARQPVADRQRKQRERERTKARERNRVMLDLPLRITERLTALGELHRVPVSQVAGLLLAEGLARLEGGEIDIEAAKRASNSPKYDWNLEYQ